MQLSDIVGLPIAKPKSNDTPLLAMDGTYYIRRAFHAMSKGKRHFATESEMFDFMLANGYDQFDKYFISFDEAKQKHTMLDPSITVNSFLGSLLKILREQFKFHAEAVILFDRGSYRYRDKTKFTTYKESRQYDDSFKVCWEATDIAIQLLRRLGFHVINIGGLEADDLGMYFSHNHDNCWLATVDSDWQQSMTASTKMLRKEEILDLNKVIQQTGVQNPLDLAILKAISSGGHDDIETVGLKRKSPQEAIDAYKAKDTAVYTQDELNKIEYNLQLTRLDYILSDDAIYPEIEKQWALTHVDKSAAQSLVTPQPYIVRGLESWLNQGVHTEDWKHG